MLNLVQSVALIGGSFLVAFGVLLAARSALYPSVLSAEPSLKDADGNLVRIPDARLDDEGLWQHRDKDSSGQPVGDWYDPPSTVRARAALKEVETPAPSASMMLNPRQGK